MTEQRWQRAVPVYAVPVQTRAFMLFAFMAIVGVILSVYREFVGLGPSSGMTDVYSWGLWKTWNVMVVTGLGSGGFAVGIAAWVFHRKRLHIVTRTAVLLSFLAYFCGLVLLAIDVGRPWNLFWMLLPWKWNTRSPLLEVMTCMTAYAVIPLFLENVPPVLERYYYLRPELRKKLAPIDNLMTRSFVFIIGLAYILPMMHQSSLGALMLLGGQRVHPLWQTPLMPLLYVTAAAFLGYAGVTLTLLLTCLFYKRPIDTGVLAEMNRIAAGLIIGWTALRFIDLLARGRVGLMFTPDVYGAMFWFETVVLIAGAVLLFSSAKSRNLRAIFNANLLVAIGGTVYRFAPPMLAFHPRAGAFYFPSAIEILIAFGFMSVAVVGFLLAIKKLAILPAPNSSWYAMASYAKLVRPEVQLTGYITAKD